MNKSSTPTPAYDIDREVMRRYGAAAQRPEAALCCPATAYDRTLLNAIPAEVLAVDYGCGDPSAHARSGEVVLDLGSGSGKACFMISQRVGPEGQVIGVDANDQMLALARKHAPEVALRIGYGNVRFAKGNIQDLGLDLAALHQRLSRQPVASVDGFVELEQECARMRRESPLVPEGSVDLVVSNCVLNLVRPELKTRLFAEIQRVLKRGGRAVISDVVCDEDPTPAMMGDPQLWSGCISGASREDRFLEAFEQAGFFGVEIVARSAQPWQVIDGIEFRSITVRAFKGKEGPCLERNQAVVYRGPWRSVTDDDGHMFPRGRRVAVCDKTYQIVTDPQGPYSGALIPHPPDIEVPLDQAGEFACRVTTLRDPRVTKRGAVSGEAAIGSESCAGPECC